MSDGRSCQRRQAPIAGLAALLWTLCSENAPGLQRAMPPPGQTGFEAP
jgi:hypothetical protein